MKERPILFSAPMVRAILDGSKTQTRRVVKPCKDRAFGAELAPCEIAGEINAGDYTHAKYGQPGDRLWAREAHAFVGTVDPGWLLYRASGYEAECARHGFDKPYPDESTIKWRPSIHMPRWASRITLEITGVRVERLQDISKSDSVAEGIFIHADFRNRDDKYGPVAAYCDLWESINGPGSWDENPWVWVIEFKRVGK